jgi:diguanylate cyclase (GGDEF)-like protein
LRLRRIIAKRVGNNVKLAIILLFSTLTVLGITPFAIARALNGEWMIVAIDVVLILLMMASASFAWRTGRAELVGGVYVVLISLGFSLVVDRLGASGLFWVFPLVVANFMLASRWLAIGGSLFLLAGSHFAVEFPSTVATGAFLVSATLVMLYSYVFASLTEAQRAQLHRLATRDPLTGAANRRSMEIELADALRLHHSRGNAAVLAVVDLDHFKQVNDLHGHEAGDQVLVDFANLVEENIRKRDRLFRFGGEEFVVLLPGTDIAGGRVALEKIRQATRDATLGPGLAVTISIGAAMLDPGDDWPAWLARADAALFRAKRAGRDRVEFDGLPAPAGERRLKLVAHDQGH